MLAPSDWNVLVVDDEPDNVGVLELVLEFHNATVRVANSGQHCLQLLEDETPSLLLVDIQMPEMSGIELLQRIRADERWNGIPVVAITAYASSEDEVGIQDAGFDGYISKPISAMTFVDEVQAILDSAKVGR